MAKRRLSEETLRQIDAANLRDEIGDAKYGTWDSHLIVGPKITDDINYYYKTVLGIEDLEPFRGAPYSPSQPGSISEVKVKNKYKNLNPILLATVNDPKWLAIRTTIASQYYIRNVEDFNNLVEKLLEFGFQDDWPSWILITQNFLFYKLIQKMRVNDPEIKKAYEKLMKNKKIPKKYRDGFLKEAYGKFKV